MTRYSIAERHKADLTLFLAYHTLPTESQSLKAIGWSSIYTDSEIEHWEDEQRGISAMKDSMELAFHKAAQEWKQCCVLLKSNTGQAAKK